MPVGQRKTVYTDSVTKQHTRIDSGNRFQMAFPYQVRSFYNQFLAAREQIVQPFGDGRVGEDLVLT